MVSGTPRIIFASVYDDYDDLKVCEQSFQLESSLVVVVTQCIYWQT